MVWHQVGLELGDIDIQGAIESQRGSQGGDNLGQQSVQVGVGWALDVQVAAADIVESLVVVHDGHISVLQQGVDAQDSVVWLHHSGGHLWARPDSEGELGLLAVVNGQALQHQAAQARASATTDSVEDHEALQASAVVSQLSDSVQDQVDNLLADGVVASSEVVGGILLTSDQLLWVEELAVGASSDLIHDSWLQVNHHASWHMLASTSLGEEGVERIVTTTDGLVGWHLTIRLDTVLQAEELPASIADLDTSLTKVQAKNLTHGYEERN